ncbi:uncharacterized protein LOC141905432 [Tubulanus polymorphus]|uniref:uncharacterized protein LOC141905432 n=1 Tax=Tubulanus polymorphus TaxID=672921 RepID=UPI003DA4CF29
MPDEKPELKDRDTILTERRRYIAFLQFSLTGLQIISMFVFIPFRVTEPLPEPTLDNDYNMTNLTDTSTATRHTAAMSFIIIGAIIYLISACSGLVLMKRGKDSPHLCIDICELAGVITTFVSTTNFVLNVALAQYLPSVMVLGKKRHHVLVGCLAVAAMVGLVELGVSVVQMISNLTLRKYGDILKTKLALAIKSVESAAGTTDQNGQLEKQDELSAQVAADDEPSVVVEPQKTDEEKTNRYPET